MIVLIITAVRVKVWTHTVFQAESWLKYSRSGDDAAGGAIHAGQAQKTSVTEIAVKEWKHPQAALTFDDGPDIRYTPLLLDGLKERNVRSFFFSSWREG